MVIPQAAMQVRVGCPQLLIHSYSPYLRTVSFMFKLKKVPWTLVYEDQRLMHLTRLCPVVVFSLLVILPVSDRLHLSNLQLMAATLVSVTYVIWNDSSNSGVSTIGFTLSLQFAWRSRNFLLWISMYHIKLKWTVFHKHMKNICTASYHSYIWFWTTSLHLNPFLSVVNNNSHIIAYLNFKKLKQKIQVWSFIFIILAL
jgi:hypothetical protein